MQTSDKHFEKKDIQTILKHILLKDYLTRWATVFMSAGISKPIKKCHFVDCFAGRGKFEDGQEGSPLIAIKNLFSLQSTFKYNKQCRFYIHTVELLEDYHNMLRQMSINSLFPSQINNYCGEFKQHVDRLLSSTKGDPALYFIDPFGYKGVHMIDIVKILSEPRHEVLINVMSYSLVRNYLIQKNQNELCKFFGIDKLPQDIAEYINMASKENVLENQVNLSLFEKLEDKILDLYIFNLKDKFKDPVYTLKKRIHSPLNPNVYFHLVFATRSRAGLVEMKDTMIAFEPLRIKAEDDYHVSTGSTRVLYADDLFSDSVYEKSYDYSAFVEEIMMKFNNSGISYGQILDHFLQFSPLPFRDDITQKSIYDFSVRLFKKNNFIRTTSQAFASLRDADKLFIHINLPKNYLDFMQMETELQQIELDLF